jgi:hypothetical protein
MFVMLGAAHKKKRSFVLLIKRIVLVWCCWEIRWLVFGAATQLVTYLVLSRKQVF